MMRVQRNIEALSRIFVLNTSELVMPFNPLWLVYWAAG
jgi:hypothetical protein